MVSLNPADFLIDDGSPVLPFLLSVRSQSLLLAAATEVQDRSNWDEMDDATWNDVEGAVSEAITEIMEEAENVAMPDNFLNLWRSTDQSLSAATTTKIVWNDEAEDYGGLYDVFTPTGNIIIPEASIGLYLIQAQAWFANTTVTAKVLTIEVDGFEVARQATQDSFAQMQVNTIMPLGIDAVVNVYAFAAVAGTIDGDVSGEQTTLRMIRLRPYPLG
jgi:hypothetical protein